MSQLCKFLFLLLFLLRGGMQIVNRPVLLLLRTHRANIPPRTFLHRRSAMTQPMKHSVLLRNVSDKIRVLANTRLNILGQKRSKSKPGMVNGSRLVLCGFMLCILVTNPFNYLLDYLQTSSNDNHLSEMQSAISSRTLQSITDDDRSNSASTTQRIVRVFPLPADTFSR